jgi:AcrR family transcriptional regulator
MLSAAREVFEEKGYRAATVGAIAATAETAHGTFYLYFKNKDDAFSQVMASIGDELRAVEAPSRDSDQREAIEVALYRFLDVFVRHPGMWRALLEGMLLSTSIEQMWLAMRTEFVDRIARGLERGSRDGIVRSLDTRQTALALASMAEWYSFTHLVLGAEHREGEGIEVAVATLTDLWYHAVYGATDHQPVAEPPW